MKKLLATILLIVTALTLFMLSACGGEETADISVEESSSSSSTKPIRSFDNDDDSTTSASTSESSEESDDPAESDKPDTSYGADGEDYVVKEIDTSTLSTNAKIVANYINDVGRVTAKNYTAKLDDISYIITQYNALTSNEKNEVSNYQSLLEAKDACDKFEKSVSDQAIADFKTTIELIKDCEVDSTFDSDIAKALSIYEQIGESYKTSVANEYKILQGANMQKQVNTLPSVDNLTGEYYKTIKELTASLTNLDASIYVKYNETKAKLDALNTKLKDVWVEITFISCDTNNNGILEANEISEPKKNISKSDPTGMISTSGAGNGQEKNAPVNYSDNKNAQCELLLYYRGDMTIRAECGGTLTIYLLGIEKEYAIKNGTEVIATHMSADEKAEIWEIELTSAGNYTISVPTQADAARIYAVKFGYPKL